MSESTDGVVANKDNSFNTSSDEGVPLIPSWEVATMIHIQCLLYGKNPAAKRGAEEELLKLARSYDTITKTERKDRHSLFSINGKPWGTLKKAILVPSIDHGPYLSAVLVAHDDATKKPFIGGQLLTSTVVRIFEHDLCLVVETENSRYIIEEGMLKVEAP